MGVYDGLGKVDPEEVVGLLGEMVEHLENIEELLEDIKHRVG